MKKIILTVLSVMAIASSAFSYTAGQIINYVKGPIVGVWVNPTNGNYSVSVQTSYVTVLKWENNAWKWQKDESIAPTTVFTVEVPNSNGISKNALAVILSARAAGANIQMGFSTWDKIKKSAVVTSAYCDILY